MNIPPRFLKFLWIFYHIVSALCWGLAVTFSLYYSFDPVLFLYINPFPVLFNLGILAAIVVLRALLEKTGGKRSIRVALLIMMAIPILLAFVNYAIADVRYFANLA